MTGVRRSGNFKARVIEQREQHDQLIASLANVRTVDEGTGLDIRPFIGRSLNSCPYAEWQDSVSDVHGDITMNVYNKRTDEDSINYGQATETEVPA